jgi:hypothetical protein
MTTKQVSHTIINRFIQENFLIIDRGMRITVTDDGLHFGTKIIDFIFAKILRYLYAKRTPILFVPYAVSSSGTVTVRGCLMGLGAPCSGFHDDDVSV